MRYMPCTRRPAKHPDQLDGMLHPSKRTPRPPASPTPPAPHQVVRVHQLEHLGQHLLCAAGHAVDVVAVTLGGGRQQRRRG